MALLTIQAAAPAVGTAPTTVVGSSGGQAADVALGGDRTNKAWAIILLLAGIAAAAALGRVWEPTPFNPAAGISAFAIFYIIAQALERLTELFTTLVGDVGATTSATDGQKVTKAAALARRQQRVKETVQLLTAAQAATAGAPAVDPAGQPVDAAALAAQAQAGADQAAKDQQDVNQTRSNRAAVLWGLNSAAAMVACAGFGLYILRMAGMEDVPKLLDVVVTGLAVGSGTKPLHDLIKNIEKAKNQKEDTAGAPAGV